MDSHAHRSSQKTGNNRVSCPCAPFLMKSPCPSADNACSLLELALDEQRMILSHVGDAATLSTLACVSRRTAELARDETTRRLRLRARAEVVEQRKKRLARAQMFADAERDGWSATRGLIATCIRHVLVHAPKTYTGNLASPVRRALPPGVCRLRVAMDATKQENTSADVLALQETTLREVVFCGEPLGPAGAAVAARQARALGLQAEEKVTLGNHTFRLFLRSDVLMRVLASSPSLQRLVAAEDAS